MRVREIIHSSGSRLRLTLHPGSIAEGPRLRIVDPEAPASSFLLLDLPGCELLAAFLMSARLTSDGELAGETMTGDHPLTLRLRGGRGGDETVVELEQLGHVLRLFMPLWDRLYAELLLVVAHGRKMTQPALLLERREPRQSQLLH